jgi:hypothetical protein
MERLPVGHPCRSCFPSFSEKKRNQRLGKTTGRFAFPLPFKIQTLSCLTLRRSHVSLSVLRFDLHFPRPPSSSFADARPSPPSFLPCLLPPDFPVLRLPTLQTPTRVYCILTLTQRHAGHTPCSIYRSYRASCCLFALIVPCHWPVAGYRTRCRRGCRGTSSGPSPCDGCACLCCCLCSGCESSRYGNGGRW